MAGMHRHTGRWWCDNVSIEKLADIYGTPLYLYSRDRMVENYRGVVTAFRPLNARVHYSVKANSSGAILKLLRELGSGFDVVSGGELFRVLRAGADPARVVFAGVGKTESELAYAIDQGIGWINVESAEELEILDRLAAARSNTPAIALRVNPSVEADTHRHIATGGYRSKFGVDLNEAGTILEHADRYPHLDIAGLHIHIGSQLASPDGTVEAVQRALELTKIQPIRLLDIGGGFPVAYRPDDHLPGPANFAEAIDAALPPAPRAFQVAIEPGRSIIADAGALVATIQYVKVREGRRIVVTDAGMTELLRPALYEAYHHIEAAQASTPAVAADELPADIAGPVCESADFLGYNRLLPPVGPGDRLVIFTAGAYGMAMASNYNSRPRPAEVLVEGATHHQIRRRETWEDLIALEGSI
jgi:diaminopimelate decarboxylase